MQYSTAQRYAAEFIGTAFLLVTVIGSGIMAEGLAGGNVAIALLGNTIPTGAILVVLITMLRPISGAHFNPAVTIVFALRREISIRDSAWYVIFQVAGGLVGMIAAHLMFDLELIQYSQKVRTGTAQWFAEAVATFGLLFTILVTLKVKPEAVAMGVGLYITAAYWFTASTSFANPAVTVARSFTDTFSGIQPGNMPAFIIAQIIGAVIAWAVCQWLVTPPSLAQQEQ
jgi:glycerol uptake facilitator-like aquaporin